MVTCALFLAYAVLMLTTRFFDPKQNRESSKKKRTIYSALVFSTVKMSVVIAIVIVAAQATQYPLSDLLWLTGLRFNWRTIGSGIIAALGFALIYIGWHALSARISAPRAGESIPSNGLIESLPSRLPTLALMFGSIGVKSLHST